MGSDVRTYLFWFRFLVRSLHLTYSGRIFFLIKNMISKFALWVGDLEKVIEELQQMQKP